MITVGLVDDEPLFTAGLAMVLEAQPDVTVVWTAENGRDAIDKCAAAPPEVLLLDIRMPVLDGLETTRRLVESGSSTKIVILTTFNADEYVLSAIESGAAGFLLKNIPPADLVEAIRTVSRGDAVLSPGPTRRLFAAYRSGGGAGERRADRAGSRLVACLTPREKDVLELIGMGLTNQEICDRLWLSMSTVKTHVSALLSKTQSRDRVQLALLALRTGTAAL